MNKYIILMQHKLSTMYVTEANTLIDPTIFYKFTFVK